MSYVMFYRGLSEVSKQQMMNLVTGSKSKMLTPPHPHPPQLNLIRGFFLQGGVKSQYF